MLTQLNEDINNSPINIRTDYKASEQDNPLVYANIYHLSPTALRKELIDHQQAMKAMTEIKSVKETILQRDDSVGLRLFKINTA